MIPATAEQLKRLSDLSDRLVEIVGTAPEGDRLGVAGVLIGCGVMILIEKGFDQERVHQQIDDVIRVCRTGFEAPAGSA